MKKIIIVHADMEIGGAETSLLSLLQSFDYSRVSVDLFLYKHSGELLSLIPKEVCLLEELPQYRALMLPIKQIILSRQVLIGIARLWSRIISYTKNKICNYTDYGYIVKQRAHYYVLPFLPKILGKYDCAISFIDPHFIMNYKINAKKKIGWFHTDFQRIKQDKRIDCKMWEKCDFIVNVSPACKNSFDAVYPCFKEKSIVIENILSQQFVEYQSKKTDIEEMGDGPIKLLSVGRFSEAKNFDNVPDICRRLLKKGMDVTWYLIGYGGGESLIRQKIIEAEMEDRVIILGKKENPYPYIAACDIYIQPSRYEGKAVTVREAQMLRKPVIITNYQTAKSQLEDGVDGIIVPMNNEGCAQAIAEIIMNKEKQEYLISNTKGRDYSNRQEIEKIYKLMNI